MTTQIIILDGKRKPLLHIDNVVMQFRRGVWKNTKLVTSQPVKKRVTAKYAQWGRLRTNLGKTCHLIKGERVAFRKGALTMNITPKR